MLNSDVKCAHCGTERVSYRLARPFLVLSGPLLMAALLFIAMAIAFHFWSASENYRHETERALQQGLNP